MEYGIIFLFFFAQGMEKNGEHRRILNERKGRTDGRTKRPQASRVAFVVT
jgi:hypothetical protein